MSTTTNYQFIKPEDGSTSWGDAVRNNFQSIENTLVQIKQVGTTAASGLQAHKASNDHDNLYFTKTQLNNGSLDSVYYTSAELTAGQLDTRYYTKTQMYNNTEVYSETSTVDLFATNLQSIDLLKNRYYSKDVITNPLYGRYYTKVEVGGKSVPSYVAAVSELTAKKNQLNNTVVELYIMPFKPFLNIPYNLLKPNMEEYDVLGDNAIFFGQRIPNVTSEIGSFDVQLANLRSWYSNLISNGKIGTQAPGDILYIMAPASKNSYGLYNGNDSSFRVLYPNV